MTLPGVVFIDHTADVGIDVRADSFEELLHRAALGMLVLLRGEDEEQDNGAGAGTTSTVSSTSGPDSASGPDSSRDPDPAPDRPWGGASDRASDRASEPASAHGVAPGPAGGEGHSRGPANGGGALEPIRLAIRAPGHARLVADWLSEILFLHEVRGVDYIASELNRVGSDILEGRVLVRTGGHAVREIKGVTYHDLEVRRGEAGEWLARVIFDV